MKKKWWHEKVAYQIYPKSFCDSNGDGIGDLRGIISKLDYLQELGIELLWISPIYCSPMADQGYDISDYYNIDPMFGNMQEMEELIAEAKKRNIGIVMDLVVNHCSDEHEWFKKACEDPDGKYGKYFYIEDVKKGELPTNVRSYFGGSCWEPLPGHPDKQYLHFFHKKQPDLNWENPEVREEVYKMVNWWLDKGLAGFRVDAIINVKKELPWRHYPADREDGLSFVGNMLKNVNCHDFLMELNRETFAKHDAFSVGEVFDEHEDALADFVGDEGCFSTIFDMETEVWGANEKGAYARPVMTPDDYRDTVFKSQAKSAGVGFMANIIENHDQPRGVSHYLPEGEVCDASKKMLATINFMVKGIPFIFQGQEIGTENVDFTSMDQIDDVMTHDEYQVGLKAGLSEEEAFEAAKKMSRDNARVPFCWDGSEKAGFTTGEPWLMIHPDHERVNLADQRNKADSVYQYYRKLIALRKNPRYKECIVWGELVPVWQDQKNLMAFYRQGEEQKLLVIANFQKEARDVSLPNDVKEVVLNNYENCRLEGRNLHLEGYQALVLELVQEEKDFSQGSMVKNILSMAVPVTIAQAVQLLYNLVDRIYLGHLSEGADMALIGVGLAFPIVSIVSAFTMLYSGGGAPLMSIARGAGEREKASKLMNVSFLLMLVSGIILMLVGYIFMKPIMYLFGASDATYPAAAAYLQIYLLGTLFVMTSSGMNLFINSQGFGTTGMLTVSIGAIMNIILDPIFIFGLHMGVRGAAVATVISQLSGCLWVLKFLTGKKATYRLNISHMKLNDREMITSIVQLGASGFIMNVTNSLTQIVCNATLAKWGGDVYVGAMTILNSVREIFHLAASGVSEGAKPVLGFNFGAKEYGRVKKGIRVTCTIVLGYMLVAWLLVHFHPEFFVGLFTANAQIAEVAVPALRLFFAGFFMMGFMFCGQSTFVGLGYPKQAIFFSLLRKVLIVVPLTVILPYFMGVDGVFIAEPISNFIGGTASFTTMLLIIMPVLSGKKDKK